VLQYHDNHWKAQAIATANYSQWYIHHKAKMEAEVAVAEANHNHIKDDRSCIKLARKRSKATIDVDTLDTTDSDIEAG
jgi:phage terminase Nu1 subunit (DNA packaging protein)